MFFAEENEIKSEKRAPGIPTEGNVRCTDKNSQKPKEFSVLTRLLILLVPMLVWAGYYTYSNVLGAVFINKTLTTNTNLEQGLVGHWTFDGPDMNWSSTTAEVLDRSGNNNHGNLLNSGAAAAAPGKLGQGMKFDGVDDYINLSSPISLDDIEEQGGGGFAVSVWIKADTMGGWW